MGKSKKKKIDFLRQTNNNKCFHCHKDVDSHHGSVEHLIPRFYYRNSNHVTFACQKCNRISGEMLGTYETYLNLIVFNQKLKAKNIRKLITRILYYNKSLPKSVFTDAVKDDFGELLQLGISKL